MLNCSIRFTARCIFHSSDPVLNLFTAAKNVLHHGASDMLEMEAV
jgi:hypothetical protein